MNCLKLSTLTDNYLIYIRWKIFSFSGRQRISYIIFGKILDPAIYDFAIFDMLHTLLNNETWIYATGVNGSNSNFKLNREDKRKETVKKTFL